MSQHRWMFETPGARARLAEGVDGCVTCGGECEYLPEGNAFSFEDFARPLELGAVEPTWEGPRVIETERRSRWIVTFERSAGLADSLLQAAERSGLL